MSIDLSHRPLAAALRQELRHELTALRGNWFWFVLLGVALVVLGTIALGSVAIASLAAAAAIGVLLLLGGVAEAVGAFWCRCWSGFFLELLSGWYCARFPARRRLEGVYQTPDVLQQGGDRSNPRRRGRVPIRPQATRSPAAGRLPSRPSRSAGVSWGRNGFNRISPGRSVGTSPPCLSTGKRILNRSNRRL